MLLIAAGLTVALVAADFLELSRRGGASDRKSFLPWQR